MAMQIGSSGTGPSIWLHADLGSDWATGTGARTRRAGLAGERTLHESVSLIAERNRAFGL